MDIYVYICIIELCVFVLGRKSNGGYIPVIDRNHEEGDYM